MSLGLKSWFARGLRVVDCLTLLVGWSLLVLSGVGMLDPLGIG